MLVIENVLYKRNQPLNSYIMWWLVFELVIFFLLWTLPGQRRWKGYAGQGAHIFVHFFPLPIWGPENKTSFTGYFRLLLLLQMFTLIDYN